MSDVQMLVQGLDHTVYELLQEAQGGGAVFHYPWKVTSPLPESQAALRQALR